MRSTLLALLLTAALLSGCVVEETPSDQATESQAQDAADAAPVDDAPEPVAEEASEPAPHGTPQRTDGPVESGMDPQNVLGAWARQTITISNDVNGADLVDLLAAIAAGGIAVQTADRDGYLVEAVLETRAANEEQARDQLARSHLDHTDALDNGTLAVSDLVTTEDQAAPVPAPNPIDIVRVSGGVSLTVHMTITVPLGLLASLDASAASGDLSATGLRGPELDLSTASGDIGMDDLAMTGIVVDSASGDITADKVAAATLDASTSSGDIVGTALAIVELTVSTASGDVDLEGAFDDIQAGSSSGDLSIDATPVASGEYDLDSASGTVTLSLPADGQAYHVDAGTASGDIDVDVPDSETLDEDERHVEVASAGFDEAAVQTEVNVSTSSGDIGVAAK